MVSPEARLLALTAGGARNDAAIAQLLETGLDINAVRRLVLRERAAGPLVRQLRRLGGPEATRIADALSQLARLSDLQAVFLQGRLRRIQAALAERNIDVLLLKGAGLAHTLYSTPLERPMGDLDLLVHREHAQTAMEVARDSGWISRRDIPMETDYGEHQHLMPLEDDQNGHVGLEFHVELFSRQAPFVVPVSQVWRSARPAPPLGPRVWIPDPHHQLLHVCLHFTWSHELQFGTWRTLRDVDVILGSGTIQWQHFVELASASRGATCCYWALRLARDLVDTPVPERVLARLAPVGPERVLDSLALHFAQTSLPVSEICPSVRLSRVFWRMAVQPRMQGHGRARPWYELPGAVVPTSNGEAHPAPTARLGELTDYIAGLLPRSRR